MSTILFTGLLLIIGVFFGSRAQKKHITEMRVRKAALSHILITNLKTLPEESTDPILVTGSVVIAFDYFRRFVAGFIMFFGGRITMYEDMLDRARREAMLRLLEEAEAKGASQVHNLRFEFSRIGAGGKGVGGGAELLAYGTAIK